MYETFFGLVSRPFLTVPTLERYYPSSTTEQTFQTAARAIVRAEGPVAIFGGTGLGKTMLCLRLAEHFRRSFDVVMLSSSQLITRRALLQSLLFELKMPYRNLNEGELRLTLMNRLQPSPENPSNGLLLIADEAQTLSPKLLDEIRLLTNITRDGMPRVRLVLCGTMKLEDCLSHPRMESLCQRLSCRSYLTPLTPQETASYVAHKIELSGASVGCVMTREALESIYRGTDGIPRLIDQLADQTLLLAAQERQQPISAALVGKAWGMLQQLPNPWSEPELIAMPEKTVASIQEPIGSSVPIENSPENVNTASVSTSAQSIGNERASMSFQLRDLLPSLEKSLEGQDDIVEYGSLDELDGEYQLAEEQDAFPNTVDEGQSVSNDSTAGSGVPTNPADLFGADFDEEFSLPIQSTPGYQAYSGIAFGNLSDESSRLSWEDTSSAYSVAEANAFLEALQLQPSETDARQPDAPIWTGQTESDLPVRAELSGFDEVSFATGSLTPSQAAMLERQIQEEMREIVSELNMNAMMFDPAQPIETEDFQTQYSQAEKASYFDSPLSLADSPSAWESNADDTSLFDGEDRWDQEPAINENRREALGDDRDILIIETEAEPVRGTATLNSKANARPVLHPYAKLFSNLR